MKSFWDLNRVQITCYDLNFTINKLIIIIIVIIIIIIDLFWQLFSDVTVLQVMKTVLCSKSLNSLIYIWTCFWPCLLKSSLISEVLSSRTRRPPSCLTADDLWPDYTNWRERGGGIQPGSVQNVTMVACYRNVCKLCGWWTNKQTLNLPWSIINQLIIILLYYI